MNVTSKLLLGTKLANMTIALADTNANTKTDVLPNDLDPKRQIIKLNVVTKLV